MLTQEGREDYIERSLSMFMRQSMTSPRELIIVHADGDRFHKWLQERTSSMHVQLLRNSGTLGARRNEAAKIATHDFIATWDDDDVSTPSRLGKQLEALLSAGAAFTAETQYIHLFERQHTAYLLRKDVGGHANKPWEVVEPSLMWNRRRCGSTWFGDSYVGEDTDFLNRLNGSRRFASTNADDGFPPVVFSYTCGDKGMMSLEHHQTIVSRCTKMPSRLIASGQRIAPSMIDLIPEGYRLITSDGMWDVGKAGQLTPYA